MTVRAPFTPAQVASLNGYQASASFHGFTCGDDACPGADGERAALRAQEDGWHCPACPYTQDWAHDSMADGSWQRLSGVTVTVGGVRVRGEIGEITG